MIPKCLFKKIKQKQIFYEKNIVKKIFSWKELISLLNLRPFVDVNRFHVLCDEVFNWEEQAWLSDVNTYPPTMLYTILNKYSCYISDASRVNSKVNEICKDLEYILGYPTDAHIYFAASNNCSQGFPVHWDWSHNFIVQVEGKTNFKVWDIEADPNAERIIDILPKDPVLDVTMEPGDVIFIPERIYHQAISLTKRMSISFPSNPHDSIRPQERFWIDL